MYFECNLILPVCILIFFPTKKSSTQNKERKCEQAHILHAPLLHVLDNDTDNEWQIKH